MIPKYVKYDGSLLKSNNLYIISQFVQLIKWEDVWPISKK